MLLLLAACGQNYNSNTGDAPTNVPLPAGDCSTPAGSRLCAAMEALRNNRCYTCHSNWNYTTDAAWIASGRVTAGNPQNSTLILKLVNNGGNMPFDTRTAISASDYNTLTTWIQNL